MLLKNNHLVYAVCVGNPNLAFARTVLEFAMREQLHNRHDE